MPPPDMQKRSDYKSFDEEYFRRTFSGILADKNTGRFHHSAVADFAAKDLKKDSYVLDVGCGAGLLSYKLSAHCGFVAGMDISVYAVEKARSMYGEEKIRWLCADCVNLPFKSGSFDCTVASEIFELMSDEQAHAAQKEIYRVLKPGASLIVEQVFFGGMSVVDLLLLFIFSSWKVKKYRYIEFRQISRARRDNPDADFYHLGNINDPTHKRIYNARLLVKELSAAGFGRMEFFPRRIFSIIFLGNRRAFNRYVRFYIKAPQIIRRLFLIDIGGRVRAVKHG